MILKRLLKMTAVLSTVLITGNTGALNAAASAATEESSAASSLLPVDVLDPDFIAGHGGNSVLVKANSNRSPFDVFAEAFGTDNPVEGVTNTARAILPTAQRHVENYVDPELGDVWKVEVHGNDCADGCYLHKTKYDAVAGTFIGGDRDRQRIEIRPNRDTTTDQIGLENDITAYSWKMKIDQDFPKPDGFCHIFQYKAVNSTKEYPGTRGSENGAPILTLTISSDLQRAEFRYTDIGTIAVQEVLASVSLDDIKGKWVETTVVILNSECGWVTMLMKEVATGKVVMKYNDPDRVLDLWRRPEIMHDGKPFESQYPAVSDQHNRVKWGIYRKAEKSNSDLKGAKIYLADLSLTKCAVGVSPVNLAYGKKAYNTGVANVNILQSRNAAPERLTDGVQVDPILYPVTDLEVTAENSSTLLGDLCWMGTDGDKKGHAVIDLGKVMNFNRVIVFAKSMRLKGINVYTSDEAADYSEADRGTLMPTFARVPDRINGTGYTYFNPSNTADDTKDAAPYVIDLGKTYSSRYVLFDFENGSGSANAATMSGPPRISEIEIYNAPQTPGNVTVNYAGGTEATISWEDTPHEYYTIYNRGRVLADHVTSNTYKLAKLEPGAVYELSVKTACTDPYSFKLMYSLEGKAAAFKTDGNPIAPNPSAAGTAGI